MTEEFKKHDQFFVNPERPEPGLTATSASSLAALASQEVNFPGRSDRHGRGVRP